jgi:hypothetical protein
MLGSMLPFRENIQTFAAMFEGYWQTSAIKGILLRLLP